MGNLSSISDRTVLWASKFRLKIVNLSLSVVRTSQSCGCGAFGKQSSCKPYSGWGQSHRGEERDTLSVPLTHTGTGHSAQAGGGRSPEQDECPALSRMIPEQGEQSQALAQPSLPCCSCPSAAPQGAPDANPSSHKTNCVKKEHMVNKPCLPKCRFKGCSEPGPAPCWWNLPLSHWICAAGSSAGREGPDTQFLLILMLEREKQRPL